MSPEIGILGTEGQPVQSQIEMGKMAGGIPSRGRLGYTVFSLFFRFPAPARSTSLRGDPAQG